MQLTRQHHRHTAIHVDTSVVGVAGSGGASSSLIDRRVSFLEENMPKQTETLLVVNAKLGSLVTDPQRRRGGAPGVRMVSGTSRKTYLAF